MQNNMTQFKCTVNGKEMQLTCDMTATTAEVKEALCQFIIHMGKIEDAHREQQKQEEEKVTDIIEVIETPEGA